MLRRSSSVLNRVGSYFGVEDTDSSLDLWKEKIQRAAKTKSLNISLANLLPSNLEDPDQDIKLLEDILAQPLTDETGNSLSDHLMSHSTEEIVSVQVLENGGDDVAAWNDSEHGHGSDTDCIAAKKVSIPAQVMDEDREGGNGPVMDGAIEMKALQSQKVVSQEERTTQEGELLAMSQAQVEVPKKETLQMDVSKKETPQEEELSACTWCRFVMRLKW
ncbi:uncharacterized protein [Amphiura filiformis]|uniref:uncharacterized protein n=1 Tax=Amphiura filiformis TaxID=82378 RepID=UPI003B213F4F